MLITTTSNLEGYEIVEYKGLVFGEVVSGMNFVKDFFSGITDVLGGRSGSYESEFQDARDKAIEEMIKRAKRLDADGIVGVDVDYEILDKDNGMVMVTVSGTAVKIR